MDAIDPIGGWAGRAAPAPVPSGPQTSPSGDPTALNSLSSLASQAVTSQSSLTQITQVYSRVDAFLGTFGANLENNQVLRMIIALMILELLRGGEREDRQSSSGRLGALGQLADRADSTRLLLIHSSTSFSQTSSQSTDLARASAVQASPMAQPDGQTGGQIDLAA